MNTRTPITIIGAGLVGSLLATLLAQRGFTVDVFERRRDPRIHGFAGGRSINLSLVERGIAPLRMAGLADAVLANTVTMVGRMVHTREGATDLQRYGINAREVDHSVGRGDLNVLLLNAAERAGAQLHFDAGLEGVQFDSRLIALTDHAGTRSARAAGLLLGCDGAGSALRAAMKDAADIGERIEPLGHGYKELEIPALGVAGAGGDRAASEHGAHGAGGSPGFVLSANALHIWPRGNYMCIALPNAAGSFTVTLFMPLSDASPSFAAVPDVAAARTLFRREFADALAHMPAFDADWTGHPTGRLATLYLEHWHLEGRALLLGDAAHAVVPFHGQGMNAGFEDAAQLATLLLAKPAAPAAVFAEFQTRRKANADAIARMSLENYVEMRDAVADSSYLLRRELGAALTERVPERFMSRYRMVSFTSMPYAMCVARGRVQTVLMQELLGSRTTLEGLDLDAAAQQVRAHLQPLPGAP